MPVRVRPPAPFFGIFICRYRAVINRQLLILKAGRCGIKRTFTPHCLPQNKPQQVSFAHLISVPRPCRMWIGTWRPRKRQVPIWTPCRPAFRAIDMPSETICTRAVIHPEPVRQGDDINPAVVSALAMSPQLVTHRKQLSDGVEPQRICDFRELEHTNRMRTNSLTRQSGRCFIAPIRTRKRNDDGARNGDRRRSCTRHGHQCRA